MNKFTHNDLKIANALCQAIEESIAPLVDHIRNEIYLGVACSGGKDSMALAGILHLHWPYYQSLQTTTLLPMDFSLKFHIFTVNHHLHPLADEHAQAVQEYWQNYGSCSILQADTTIIHAGLGLEEGARRARYQAFADAVEIHQIDYMLLAHHLHDQVETLIMRLHSVSGVQGMRGIPKQRDYILRPWLHIDPQWIIQIIEALQLPVFEDPSNQDTRFLRNRIRHHVIPAFQNTLTTQWAQCFHNSALQIREQWDGVDYFLRQHIHAHCKTYSWYLQLSWNDGLTVPLATQKLIVFMIWKEALMLWTPQNADPRRIREHIPRLLAVWCNDRYQTLGLPYQLQAWGGKGKLQIYSTQHMQQIPVYPMQLSQLESDIQNYLIKFSNAHMSQSQFDQSKVIKHVLKTFSWSVWKLLIYIVILPVNDHHHRLLKMSIPLDCIHFPLSMRMPYQGERFWPCHAQGSKKLKKIWSDLHIPPLERQYLPVVVDAQDDAIYLPLSRVAHYHKDSVVHIPDSLKQSCQVRVYFDWHTVDTPLSGLPSTNLRD